MNCNHYLNYKNNTLKNNKNSHKLVCGIMFILEVKTLYNCMDFSKSLISLPFYLLWPPIIALKMWLINAKGFAKVKRAKPVLSNEMIVPLWFYAFLFGCFWNFITPRQCLLKNVFANLPLWEYPGSLPIFSFSILPIPFFSTYFFPSEPFT